MRSRRSEVKKGVEDSDRVDFTTNGAAGRDPELINRVAMGIFND